MEKASGVPLRDKWEGMSGDSVERLIKTMIGYEKAFASTRFKLFGSLYYKDDLAGNVVPGQRILYTDEDGREVPTDKFAIGPTTDRKAFEDGRGTMHFDRGPCEYHFPFCKQNSHVIREHS
jgi:hypothetical protein